MYSYLVKIANWLSTYTSYFIIAVAVVTYLIPELFTWVHGTTVMKLCLRITARHFILRPLPCRI